MAKELSITCLALLAALILAAPVSGACNKSAATSSQSIKQDPNPSSGIKAGEIILAGKIKPKAKQKGNIRPSSPKQLSRPARPSQVVRPADPKQISRPARPSELVRPAQPKQLNRPSAPKH